MHTRAKYLLSLVGTLALVAGPAALAAVTFQDPASYTVGAGPRDIATADLNQDGALGVLTADNGSGLSVLLGLGGGSLAPAVSFPTGLSPAALATGDLDGDGFVDAVVGNSGDDTLTVLFGDGTGWFSQPVPYAVGTDPVWVAVGDLDLDGEPDVVVANRSDVAVLRGAGMGTLAAAEFHAAANQPAEAPWWIWTPTVRWTWPLPPGRLTGPWCCWATGWAASPCRWSTPSARTPSHCCRWI
jgi:hypothetical protein